MRYSKEKIIEKVNEYYGVDVIKMPHYKRTIKEQIPRWMAATLIHRYCLCSFGTVGDALGVSKGSIGDYVSKLSRWLHESDDNPLELQKLEKIIEATARPLD